MNLILGMFIIFLLLLYFNNYRLSKLLSITICIVYTSNLFLLILDKGIEQATDYKAYTAFFQVIKNKTFIELVQLNYFEPIFKLLSWILLKFTNENAYILLVLLINSLLCIGIYKYFENKILSIITIFLYSNITFFLVMSTNIIRQTLVISLLFIIIANYNKYKSLIIILPFIHVSALPISLFLLVNKYLKIKHLMYLLFISILLFLTNLNSIILGKITFISEYNNVEIFEFYGGEGNRYDFCIFTLVILLLSVFLYKRGYLSLFMLKYTSFTGIYFYLFGFQAFSERIAIYNWYLIILFIPLLINTFKKESITT